MKNSLGNSMVVTLFGESHGKYIGCMLDGLAPGIKVDDDFINHQLSLRRPRGLISTQRVEADEYTIASGVFEGYTTGTPLTIIIPNSDQHSKDYGPMRSIARPGHADYTAFLKYHGFEDYRGGGHFSGRITAALVAAGAIVIPALKEKGILIGTHIRECAGVPDRNFCDYSKDIEYLNNEYFAVLDKEQGELMNSKIEEAASEGDSVGGILETVITGMIPGCGEPFFDSLESLLSHALFSVPAIKGVEFGEGFNMSRLTGSVNNDSFYVSDDGNIKTKTNNNGGINGGISNGMPIIIKCAVKPTPSIYKEQDTVDFLKGEDTKLSIAGRHDPAIIHRARVVVDSVVALTLYDVLSGRFGTDYFKVGNK